MSNTINIGKNIVEIDTNSIYKAIEIDFQGNLSISNLLPNDYLVKKGSGKLIILRLNTGNNIYSKLFRYYGSCIIYGARLVDENNKVQNLTINKNYIQTWNKITSNWGNLTINYKDLSGSIRNDGYEKTIYIDDGTNSNTKIQQKIITYPNRYKKDRNMKILGNQYTNGAKYKEKGKKTPYKGSYHVYLDTLKVMTGEMPQQSSKQLVKLTKKKTKGLVGKIRRSY